MIENFHAPVMLNEALEYLNVRAGGKYIDATIGGGGHSAAILKKGGCVLGIDVDPEAIDFCHKQLKNPKGLRLIQGNFKDIDGIAKKNNFGKVSGILFDLGMSSWQIEKSGRGFSFSKDESLDMRMNPRLAVTAADLVNGLSKKELYDLFTKFGEEKFSRPIADFIVRIRRVRPITKTRELAKLVEKVYKNKFGQIQGHAGRFESKIHPATRVFQALRIVVNDELENLRVALPKAIDLLELDGRLVVISFHSLEDRIVKQQFSRSTGGGKVKSLTKKPVRPSPKEIQQNPRARSAKLRAIEKL